ncbi:MAG: SHOCT domain-containing protein [Erysipelotrichaceae bacterium]|nr:SHOCT domain-containing protein [Erysipelotrichaceae bacterium]
MTSLTGNGCTVTWDERSIRVDSKMEGCHEIPWNQMESVTEWKQDTEFGSFQMIAGADVAAVKFDLKQKEEFEEIYEKAGAFARQGIARLVTSYRLAYVGGNTGIPRGSSVTLEVYDKFLLCVSVAVRKGIERTLIPFTMVEHIRIETQDEIKERFEDHRVLLSGPLATMFKKKPKKKQKLLTLDAIDPNGQAILLVFEGDAVYDVQALVEPLVRKEEQPKKKETAMDPYEEMKKVKELLDLGIIDQEDFEKKKKELLNL